MIQVGSKSFSLAARVFGSDTRDAAFCLYGWCRYCDDQIDESSAEEAPSRLENLKKLTHDAYDGKEMTHPVFQAFQYITQKYSIPRGYPLELLEGMAMDVRGDRYKTFDELDLYCYRVAGVVGLMMSHIMGFSDKRALRHADHMGKAMQLTNIARDVNEDAALGRVYLPEDWMREVGLSPEDVLHMRQPEKIAHVVERLLEKADDYYRLGDAGLKYLSFRSACSISAARHVYADIGRLVRKRNKKAWEKRAVVSLPRKLFVMMVGIVKVPLRTFWRHV